MNQSAEEINGASTTLAVERALTELRRGRAVDIVHGGATRRVAALETMSEALMKRLLASTPGQPSLLLSEERARVLGLIGSDGIELAVVTPVVLAELQAAAGLRDAHMPNPEGRLRATGAADPGIAAALELARAARLVPALLSVPRDAPAPGHVLEVAAERAALHIDSLGRCLEPISRARVPLEGHSDCEIVLYRETSIDAEHVAILIGRPSSDDVALVRLHSACLTGDLLGSLRCDCGEQLRTSIERIADAGGGVLLYLAQEGRGIGLANKLRAYALQDAGLDTIDADQHLGFSADERSYQAAAAMLRDLGLTRIRLMTNNPSKIEALRAEGIELVDHVRLSSTVNPHNERYLRTKRNRAGHL